MNDADKGAKPQLDNEIDLLAISQQAGKVIQQYSILLFEKLGLAALFLLRKSGWILAFICIGCVLSVVHYKVEKRYYTSTIMARANVLDNTYFVKALAELNGLKPQVLARVLDLPDSVTEQVHSIKTFYGVDRNGDGIVDEMLDYKRYQKNVKDTTYNIAGGIFYVQVAVYDELHFPELSRSIMHFANANEHVVEHERFRQYRIAEELAGVDMQVRRLDSLQQSEYQKDVKSKGLKLGGSQLLMLNEKDRQLFHDHVFGLHSRKLSLEAERALYSGATTVMRDLMPLAKPTNTMFFYVKRMVPIFLIFGLAFIILRHYGRKIWYLVINR